MVAQKSVYTMLPSGHDDPLPRRELGIGRNLLKAALVPVGVELIAFLLLRFQAEHELEAVGDGIA
jgi:hypothetical protein